jgi:hypothetical protein
MTVFREVVHYLESDPDCNGDYCYIEIFQDDELVAQYGDHYHEKGRQRAEGFFDAVNVLLGDDWEYEHETVADVT